MPTSASTGELTPGRHRRRAGGRRGNSPCSPAWCRCAWYTPVNHGYTALDNRCPHQGGPLGEGQLDGDCLICRWHGYEYHPANGTQPPGFSDGATAYPVQLRDQEIYVSIPEQRRAPTVSDQMVAVMTDWGGDPVFGMVGHSNLGFADALRRAADDGRLRYFGVCHEGAAAFAASA